jgi:hypothetical protein
VDIDLPRAPMAESLKASLREALSPDASAEARQRFARAWQARVAAMFPD